MRAPVAIIGPGAVGLLLARSLRRAGEAVRLVDARRLPAAAPPVQAAFLCVKSAGLPRAIGAARRLAGTDAPVVCLLNGVSQVRPMLRAFGPERSVFGSAYFAALRDGRGRARLMGGRTILIARERANAPAATAALRLLRRSGWDARARRGRDRMLWAKLAFNAATNPVGALACATNGALAAEPALRELMSRAGAEACRAAAAAGFPMSARVLRRRLLRACRATPEQRNSMLQDLDAGRPTEVRQILGPLLSSARRSGKPAPVLFSLYKSVLALERTLAGTQR